jgi:hypothetical protein
LRPKKQFKSEVTENVNQMRKQMFRKSIQLIGLVIVVAALGSSASVAQGTMSERQAWSPTYSGCAAISFPTSARSSPACAAMKRG